MIRTTTIFFCLLLAAAAAGRYRAENEVRSEERNIDVLRQQADGERDRIQVLRSEVAYLESPERLSSIVREWHAPLKPMKGSQMITAEQFIARFDGEPLAQSAGAQAGDNDFIMHALAMAEIESSAR